MVFPYYLYKYLILDLLYLIAYIEHIYLVLLFYLNNNYIVECKSFTS